MPETRIDATSVGTIQQEDYSVDTEVTDGPTGQKEFRWMNEDWTQNFGYYRSIPEVTSVIDAKATWTVGKGFQADDVTTLFLDTIKGWGKDTFNTILENMIRTYQIGGDAYCEIITDDKGKLINLKVLAPESMVHVSGPDGMLLRYEQISKVKGQETKKLDPNKIFHLSRNRVADEVHGQSMIKVLADIILMKNEAMADYKIVMHRFVVPQWKFKLKTDDPAEIAAYKAKQDAVTGTGKNIYEPFDVSESELVSIPPNSTLNPITWIEMLDAKFYEAAQVPKIIVGGTGAITEAAVKIAYLAFQQTIEEEQLFIEEQVLSQLNLLIELEFPASLENELLSDNAKDKTNGAVQPNEVTAGVGQ